MVEFAKVIRGCHPYEDRLCFYDFIGVQCSGKEYFALYNSEDGFTVVYETVEARTRELVEKFDGLEGVLSDLGSDVCGREAD